jgi:hypothetical protein
MVRFVYEIKFPLGENKDAFPEIRLHTQTHTSQTLTTLCALASLRESRKKINNLFVFARNPKEHQIPLRPCVFA